MVEAVVEHDYDAKEYDELTLKKGDIISNIEKKPGGWWEGTLQRLGKRGMFPDNFVKVLGGGEKKTSESEKQNTKSLAGRKCKVLYSYTSLAEDELNLNIGDIIDIVGEVEEGWWRGKLRNTVGVFPSNFVSLVGDINENSTTNDSQKRPETVHETSTSEESKDVKMSKSKESSSESSENLPALPPKPSKEVCKVLYAYKAANDDELSLEEGDIITIISKDVQDPGWWKGELKGKIGVFPDNFVKIVSSAEEAKPDRPTKATKGKDSIIKSSSSAAVYSSSASNAVSRKFSDSIRPTVSVKPLLPPPPHKKPSLSPVDSGKQTVTNRLSGSMEAPAELISTSSLPKPTQLIKQMSAASRLETTSTEQSTSPPTAKPSLIRHMEQEKAAAAKSSFDSIPPTSASRASVMNNVTTTSVSSKSGGSQSETKRTVIETSDSADGISWSSTRQSYSVTSSSNVVSSSSTSSSSIVTSSNSAGNGDNMDLDLVSRSAMLTHPTASRAKVPKRRLPSTLLSREDSRESADSDTMVNGNMDTPPVAPEKQASNKQPPWFEELKFNQAKNKKTQSGSKTRVMIGSTEGGSNLATSSSSAFITNEISKVCMRQVPPTAIRPLSLQAGDLRLDQNPESTITLSLLQWNQLCDKVTKLETEVEDQKRVFSNRIKELLETVELQAQKQNKMLSDLERLTDLVTRV